MSIKETFEKIKKQYLYISSQCNATNTLCAVMFDKHKNEDSNNIDFMVNYYSINLGSPTKTKYYMQPSKNTYETIFVKEDEINEIIKLAESELNLNNFMYANSWFEGKRNYRKIFADIKNFDLKVDSNFRLIFQNRETKKGFFIPKNFWGFRLSESITEQYKKLILEKTEKNELTKENIIGFSISKGTNAGRIEKLYYLNKNGKQKPFKINFSDSSIGIKTMKNVFNIIDDVYNDPKFIKFEKFSIICFKPEYITNFKVRSPAYIDEPNFVLLSSPLTGYREIKREELEKLYDDALSKCDEKDKEKINAWRLLYEIN